MGSYFPQRRKILSIPRTEASDSRTLKYSAPPWEAAPGCIKVKNTEPEESLRRPILTLLATAICAAAQLAAQAGPTHPGPSKPIPLQATGLRARSAAKSSAGSSAKPQAPVFDATALGSPLLLDKNWRVGITADPAASSVGFDDSGWAVRGAQAFMEEVSDEDRQAEAKPQGGVHVEVSGADADVLAPTEHGQRYAWFRLHIKLAENHGPVALLIEVPVTQNTSMGVGSAGPGAEVFANGQKILPEGPHASDPQRYQLISRVYNLNIDPSVTTLTLAVRTIYIPFGHGSYTTFFAGRNLMLGDHIDLERELGLWQNRSFFERLPPLVYSVLLTVLALFLFALYFSQKGHPEYLLLALHELVQAPIGFVELAGSSARLDTLWYAALLLELVFIAAYLFFEFLVAFLALRRRWYIQLLRYTSPILAGAGPTLLMIGDFRLIGVVVAFFVVGSFIWLAGWSLFVFVTLFAAALRRNFEAALLLIPLVLSLVGVIEPVVTASMNEWGGHEYRSPLTVQAGPVPIHFASIADFTGILVIVLIIFFRFLRVQRTEERATSELAAARSVQELLIPLEKQATPGFEVDSIYSPANEVGGDFFHVQMIGADGMLVVIGDVAGKGLKAAMNVSMLMGALRRTAERNPAKILESLNRVLVGTESFTTCQAAWFGLSGELVLANAGHLPPYLNSQEIAVEAGLPLGILPNASYQETRLYLHPGDRMLLLSDGVVEARRPSGELFGFDRVHNLSNQSAFYLAEAAKSFGQEDDITVLTVRRLAQMAAA
jgi:sigma-B regulation protein RsbU (phosphoserine phosphatase)